MILVEGDCPMGICPCPYQQAGGSNQPLEVIEEITADSLSLPSG